MKCFISTEFNVLWLPEGPNAWDKRSFLCQLLWIIKVTLSWIMAALYLLSDPALVVSKTIAPDHIKLDLQSIGTKTLH